MDIDSIKSALNRFINSDYSEVLILKGPWGVGKTHCWNSVVSQIPDEKDYVYISLFGHQSIESIVNEITISRLTHSEGEIETTKPKNWARKVGSLFSEITNSPFVRNFTGDLFSKAAFLQVKDSIICFDDLERSSAKLDLKDVLGLVSKLKEERKCRVAIIYNEDEFSKEDREVIRRQKEKIADVEIEFPGSPEYSTTIVFDQEIELHQLASSFSKNLGLENFRTLFFIRRLISLLEESLKNENRRIVVSTLKQLVLLAAAQREGGSRLPSIKYIKSFKGLATGFFGNSAEPKPEWYQLLSSYEFSQLNAIGLSLEELVVSGVLDKESLERGLTTEKKLLDSSDGFKEYVELLQALGALKINPANLEEYLDNIENRFHVVASSCDSGITQMVLQRLRHFSRNTAATKVIELYLEKNERIKDDSYRHFVRSQGGDQVLSKALEEKFEEEQKSNSLAQVYDKFVSGNYRIGNDKSYLSTVDVASVKEFIMEKGFVQINGQFVLEALKLEKNSDSEAIEVGKLFKSALYQIGQENEIFQLAIKLYLQIDLEDLEP